MSTGRVKNYVTSKLESLLKEKELFARKINGSDMDVIVTKDDLIEFRVAKFRDSVKLVFYIKKLQYGSSTEYYMEWGKEKKFHRGAYKFKKAIEDGVASFVDKALVVSELEQELIERNISIHKENAYATRLLADYNLSSTLALDELTPDTLPFATVRNNEDATKCSHPILRVNMPRNTDEAIDMARRLLAFLEDLKFRRQILTEK